MTPIIRRRGGCDGEWGGRGNCDGDTIGDAAFARRNEIGGECNGERNGEGDVVNARASCTPAYCFDCKIRCFVGRRGTSRM